MKKTKRYYLPTLEIDKQIEDAFERALRGNLENTKAGLARNALRKFFNLPTNRIK